MSPCFVYKMSQKQAITVDEQIALLKKRGMRIENEEKAKEILLDIGYYRLGFYSFPFEVVSPAGNRERTHKFNNDTSFDKVVYLYYFDFDLRCILLPYLQRIEVSLRTSIIYHVSLKCKSDPIWFAKKQNVSEKFLSHLGQCYESIKKNSVINSHHKKYPEAKYAPAWKTLEFMTFGDITHLYAKLKDRELKKEIAERFKIRDIQIFENYLNAIRQLRNHCAHGHSIYDLNLPKALKQGPICKLKGERCHNLTGCILVILYILEAISNNRRQELVGKLLERIKSAKESGLNDILSSLEETIF